MMIKKIQNKGEWSLSSIHLFVPLLNKLLNDKKLHRSIHHAAVRSLISAPMGELGIDCLVIFIYFFIIFLNRN